MKSMQELIAAAKSKGPKALALVQADKESLEAVKLAQELGLISPVLFGDEAFIKASCQELGIKDAKIIDAKSAEEAAVLAVAHVRRNEAQILMKGLVNTSVYMRAILNREIGLRTGELLCSFGAYEIEGRLIYASDSGVNPAPNLEQKTQILKSSLNLLRRLGLDKPKVAALAASEVVDSKIISTTDAASLVDMSKNNAFGPCVVEGPLALDVIFSKEAALHKGIKSEVSGEVDFLLFPNIETGNALVKSWLHFLKAPWAGIVLGASASVVLSSRSDNAQAKMQSIALAALAADTNQRNSCE